jgi:hypothetical protein
VDGSIAQLAHFQMLSQVFCDVVYSNEAGQDESCQTSNESLAVGAVVDATERYCTAFSNLYCHSTNFNDDADFRTAPFSNIPGLPFGDLVKTAQMVKLPRRWC